MVQSASLRLVTEATLATFLTPINTSITNLQNSITTLQSSVTALGSPSTFPYPFYATGSAYAGRPITPRPVWWMSWDVAPPTSNGTVTSGTGPVPDLDFVFVAPGVIAG